MFDLGVAIVLGLSALLSFYRGFLREVMSLGAWIAAAIITLYTFPAVSKMIEPQVKSAAIASGLASMGVFMIALVLISILSGLIVRYIKPGEEIGFLDNLIGLMFGIARGVLLVAIAYFIMTLVIAPKDYPEWVKTAKTRPYVAKTAHLVAKLAPSYLDLVMGEDKDKQKAEGDGAAPVVKKPQTGDDNADEDVDVHRGADKPSTTLPTLDDLQKRIHDANDEAK
jgi:uncharacterized membrane protein required for colicin V production